MINIQVENMAKQITSRLKNKQPVSITRYGDGEAIVLNGFNDMDKIKYVMKRQFGFIPPVEHIESIRQNLIEAYKGSDIIGIPVNRRLHDTESFWYKAFDILNHAVGIEVLHSKTLTSIDFHSYMLDNKQFGKLLTGLNTLCYISCRDLDDAFKKRYKIKNVYSFIIAPEAKFTNGYKGKVHYPDQFNEIRRWVTKIPVAGNLCLIGAGFTGKIYNNWFRDQGGIAVDLGCVFDYWAGKVTRGPNKGADAVDNTYKL